MNIINEYAANPVNNYEMKDYTVKHEEGNIICGDGVIVFLKIKDDNTIEEFSFSGYPSTVTTATTSMLAEEIEGRSIEEVLERDYEFFKELGIEISPRRKRAAVTGLLAVRNAVHKYLDDGKEDDFDNLIQE